MLGKMVSFGFSVSTLPARLAYRSAAGLFNLPADLEQLTAALKVDSVQVVREIEMVLSAVDQEMRQKAGNLSPEQQQQAAELALRSAEQHLSMAAVNVLRAIWLGSNARKGLEKRSEGVIIDQ
jgi:hypothetical protein